MPKIRYTKQVLEEAVAESASIAGVLRYLELKQAGGTHYNISRLIKKHEIDTTHFTGQRWNKGKTFPERRADPMRLFVVRDVKGPYTLGYRLREAMIAVGVPYVCVECGQESLYNNKKLVLQVDHINGKRWDDQLCNLRFLCPNCHSQTDTFSARNKN